MRERLPVTILIALVLLGVFAFVKCSSDRCESAGGRQINIGRELACVDPEGRLIAP